MPTQILVQHMHINNSTRQTWNRILAITTNRYSQNMYNIKKSLAYYISTRITMHHILKARIAFTQHVTIVENTRPMQNIILVQIPKRRTPYPRKRYSPKSSKNGVKFRNPKNTNTPSININIYILIYLERVREKREK